MTFSSRLHYVWIILVLGTLVVAGALGLARFGYTVVLPAMQEDLGLSNTQTGMLATANMIGYLALSAIGGALASRYGPRIIIVLGLILTGIAMFFTGLAQGFFSAAFWRAVTGIGSGASNVAVMGLIAPWFAPKRRGFASGIIVSGSSIALILIGPLVPRLLALVGNSGWRVCWMIFGAVTFFLALLCALFLRNRPAEVGAQPFGASSSEPSPLTVKSKVMEWGRVYRSIPVWHLGIVYTAFGFSYVIYMTFFAKYLIAEGGYTREAAGNLFMIVGWCSLFCGIIWGCFMP
jgi:MFS family permease